MIQKQTIQTQHGNINTPAFLPDATYGAVKSLSFKDLQQAGVNELVTTTLHLEQSLNSNYIKDFGGLHKFFNWDRPILTDSGGFQVFSLVYRNQSKDNFITNAGASFVDYKTGKHSLLTPEISQIIQHNLGSDIRVVLDEPVTHDGATSQAANAVNRTTEWAKRSKQKFLELHNLTQADFDNPSIPRPKLVAVIQGGNNFELRKRSANELKDIGFDIYGFGGLPLHNTFSWQPDAPTGFYHELLDYVAGLLPTEDIKYGLGIGTPDDLIYCANLGWHIFDTVLPTRNARHGYLYVKTGVGDKEFKNYSVMHIKSERYKMDNLPVDESCNCECCTTVSRAYLRHLIRTNESAGHRLASIHNLYFFEQLMQELRG